MSLPVRTRCIAIRLSLRLKRKTSGLLCMSTVAFLYALSPALIDAIPLKCSLSKETSSGLGSTGFGTTEEEVSLPVRTRCIAIRLSLGWGRFLIAYSGLSRRAGLSWAWSRCLLSITQRVFFDLDESPYAEART